MQLTRTDHRPAFFALVLPGVIVVCCAVCGLTDSPLVASDFAEGFESDQTSWQIGSTGAKVLVHRRTDQKALVRSGRQSEELHIETHPGDAPCRLVHAIPPTLRMDETQVAAWVMSDHPGIAASVRVRFPKQIDPRTKRPLVVALTGDQHPGGNQWQRLAVKLDDRAYASEMRRFRELLAREVGIRSLNDQGAYIDQFVIHMTNEARVWRLAIDDLELSPVITPPDLPDQDEARAYSGPQIRIGDDRILLDGQLIFPIFMPYHGEHPTTLASSLCNVIWVPDYQDHPLLQKCAEAGLGVMAAPPQPNFARESPDEAGLVPFGPETDPVLLWLLDVRIPGSQVETTTAWAEMVRDADGKRERPILADVTSSEREFNRGIDFLGASRSVLHTSVSPRSYLETLETRRRYALPGKPMFTLIPTEPSPELLNSRFAGAAPVVVEPEQIWMLSNAALAAGYKGLGYLTFESLEGNGPGCEERRRAIELGNTRIRLIEPWLATGKVLPPLPVQVGPPAAAENGKRLSPLTSRWDVRPHANDQSENARIASKIRATAMECDQGLIILVNWIDDDAQFQPSGMTANDVYLLLNRNIVHAWELTTTSLRDHTIEVTPAAGGTQIRLKNFDQSAVILISKDQTAEKNISRRIEQFRPIASKAWVDLARAKLTRVRAVHEELVTLAPRTAKVPNAEGLLRQANYSVDQAEKALAADRLTEVEQHAQNAMLSLRRLQHAHWTHATQSLTSPVSSPHTLCFQTLPDHWRMTSALHGEVQAANADVTVPTRLSESANLLPTGEFEDIDELLNAGWTLESPEQGPLIAKAELLGPGRSGRSCLFLSVTPATKKPLPPTIETPLVVMTSPAIRVLAGQLIRIQGQYRIPTLIRNSQEGLVITDSLLGATGALRLNATGSDWASFEVLREAPRDGELRLQIELKGIGTASIDRLQVTAVELAR